VNGGRQRLRRCRARVREKGLTVGTHVPERERARESESATDERGRAAVREERAQRGSAHWRAGVGQEGVTRERARARGESMAGIGPSEGERGFSLFIFL
jgi:hypothetical protein